MYTINCIFPFRNPSTNFIWQQIINNIKTKSEVEVIKRNILLKRFKKTSGEVSIIDSVNVAIFNNFQFFFLNNSG